MRKRIIRVKNFGGRIGWNLKKMFPHIAAEAYIKTNFLIRRRRTRRFIDLFCEKDVTPPPRMVLIETVNRCNSVCEFCPANRRDDRRPFARLSNEDFYKIISELKEWNYKGIISLYVNNEPLIDDRIIDFHSYVKEQLPQCHVKFFTNGTLLTESVFKEIIKYVDYMVINNYGENIEIHHNIDKIIDEVNNHKEKYLDKEIIVNIRYIRDILTNRAGEAPNKKENKKIIKEPCINPFTDLTIFSNGNAGICCNDATEKTNLGNIRELTIREIWETGYRDIRKAIRHGRDGYSFCRYCDTLDSGYRIREFTKYI